MMFRAFILCFAVCCSPIFGEVNVLALSGSTRQDSLNKKLLAEAVQIAEQRGATVTVFDLKANALPFYEGDLEAQKGMPENAKKFRRLMLQSDLVIIASPEYNGSVTPVLKNAIDWASRNEEGKGSSEAYKGKRFLIISASPGGGGGARSLRHLREILTNLGAEVQEEQVTVPRAHETLGNRNAPYYKQLQTTINSAISEAS